MRESPPSLPVLLPEGGNCATVDDGAHRETVVPIADWPKAFAELRLLDQAAITASRVFQKSDGRPSRDGQKEAPVLSGIHDPPRPH